MRYMVRGSAFVIALNLNEFNLFVLFKKDTEAAAIHTQIVSQRC